MELNTPFNSGFVIRGEKKRNKRQKFGKRKEKKILINNFGFSFSQNK